MNLQTQALPVSFRFLSVFFVFFFSAVFCSQVYGPDVLAQTNYVNPLDKSLTIKRVAILPVHDNVSGIYARTVEAKLLDLVKASHRFDLVDVKDFNVQLSLDDYAKDSELVKSYKAKHNVDALIGGRILKQERTIDVALQVFLTSDGKLLVEDKTDNISQFRTSEIEATTAEHYHRLINRLPFKGLVLSRQGQGVTIDLGLRDGLRKDMVLSIEQILSLKRHPRFNFILGSEKEVLGKIRILKADETLSFAAIIHEKERGVIEPNSKVTGIDFVTYSSPNAPTAIGPDLGSLQPSEDKLSGDPVSFGKNPKEWLPENRPRYGMLGVGLALGNYRNSISLRSAGSFSNTTPIYPQLDVFGEIWITPRWFVGADMRQGILSIANTQPASTPSTLNATTSRYAIHGGYRFLLQDDFFGPRIDTLLGFSRHTLFVDASTPLTYTSTTYGGLYIGVGGSAPLSSDNVYVFDVLLTRHLFPSLTETPQSSGATSDNSVTIFSFGGQYKLNNQFRFAVHLEFEFFSTTYTGGGTRGDAGLNASQSSTNLLLGIHYLF
jgi:hypothetical protein